MNRREDDTPKEEPGLVDGGWECQEWGRFLPCLRSEERKVGVGFVRDVGDKTEGTVRLVPLYRRLSGSLVWGVRVDSDSKREALYPY